MPYHHAPILVIDDDPALLELAREALADEGYDALTLDNHVDAQRVLSAGRFALVLADTAGPWVADRWPALEAVRDAAGDTPVVIFSARDPRDFGGYAARGFAGFVRKPFDLDTLLDIVRATLTGNR
jgi:DNA-binding NtrC family response regulator